ncbi:MAG: MMPL family transporter [Candidatus Woesearchaeota archaeon]
MLENIARNVVALQIKHPYSFIAVFGIIAFLLALGIPLLVGNVEPSLERVLPQNIEEIETMNNMRAVFGADMMFIKLTPTSGDDVRNPAYIRYAHELSERLVHNDYVLEVNSIADLFTAEHSHIPNTLYETQAVIRDNRQSSLYLSPDYDFMIIRLRTDTGSAAQLIAEVVESVERDIDLLEERNPGLDTEITGMNAIDRATFTIIMSDFAVITGVSMLLIAIVVWITFGSLLRGMLPMIVVMNALIWTMGITGYLGLTITVVSMVAAAMIMGLGIDFGIHVIHNYTNYRKKMNKEKAITETMSELLRAMLGSSLTTTAGFLALLFGVLPAMKTLGIILGIGIMSTFIAGFFLMPVIIYLVDSLIITQKHMEE